MSIPFPPLYALILGLMAGIAALSLVANELGRRTRLSPPARLVLAGGLGLGVIAVAIKVGIVSVVTLTGGQGLSEAGRAARGWWLSCASCHGLEQGGDDDARVSTGYLGQVGDRNAPTVLNAAFLTRLFWDGRAASLEHQAAGPFTNPVEMAMPSMQAVAERVAEDAGYQVAFTQVFGGADPITPRNITRAIAAYERTLITPDSPYDRFVRGDDGALSPQALRGMALFDDIGCRACHVDPVFSAAGSEKPAGTYRVFPVHPADNPYLARYDLLVEGRPARFRVPSLRNVALTAPYFHNGAVDELEEAIRIMVVSQLGRRLDNDPLADLRVAVDTVEGAQPGRVVTLVDQRAISDREVADLAAFLRSLTGSVSGG